MLCGAVAKGMGRGAHLSPAAGQLVLTRAAAVTSSDAQERAVAVSVALTVASQQWVAPPPAAPRVWGDSQSVRASGSGGGARKTQ